MPRPITEDPSFALPEWESFINNLSDDAYDVIENRWLDAEEGRTQYDFENDFLRSVRIILQEDKARLGHALTMIDIARTLGDWLEYKAPKPSPARRVIRRGWGEERKGNGV